MNKQEVCEALARVAARLEAESRECAMLGHYPHPARGLSNDAALLRILSERIMGGSDRTISRPDGPGWINQLIIDWADEEKRG